MRSRTFGALAALTVLACQDPRGPSLALQMDSTVYGRDSTGRSHAGFTVTNFGTTPAYLQGCPKPSTIVVDTRHAGGWREFVSTEACLAIFSPASQVLQPGQSYTDSFPWDWPATYRIRLFYGPSPGNAYAMQTVGAPFMVR
jgi:hypothetical protein